MRHRLDQMFYECSMAVYATISWLKRWHIFCSDSHEHIHSHSHDICECAKVTKTTKKHANSPNRKPQPETFVVDGGGGGSAPSRHAYLHGCLRARSTGEGDGKFDRRWLACARKYLLTLRWDYMHIHLLPPPSRCEYLRPVMMGKYRLEFLGRWNEAMLPRITPREWYFLHFPSMALNVRRQVHFKPRARWSITVVALYAPRTRNRGDIMWCVVRRHPRQTRPTMPSPVFK